MTETPIKKPPRWTRIRSVIVWVFLICFFYLTFKPVTIRTERDVTIDAGVDRVFPFLNEPKKWSDWWNEGGDFRSGEFEFQGPEKGLHATQLWQSTERHPSVGEVDVLVDNSLVITSSEVNHAMGYERAYLPKSPSEAKDFAFRRHGTITLLPQENGTKIVWIESWRLGWGLKANRSHLEFAEGKKIEKALTDLKQLVEENAPNGNPEGGL